MSNLLSADTTSEYMMNAETESTEPPPPYSEFPTETPANNNNNEQPTNEYIHNHNSFMPEQPVLPASHFAQQPLPHPHMFPFLNEYPLPPSVPHHITPSNIHLQLPYPTQFSHPNVRTPLLPETYYPPMHSPINETHPFFPPHNRSRRSIERVYSVSPRTTTRHFIESEEDNCCTAPCELSTWGCLVYLILFSLPFGLFCFIWVIATSIVCFATLLLPPLGYVICLITAASYRMLGRIELVTQQLCGGHPRLFRVLGYPAYPPVFSLDSPYPVQGCFSSSLSYITDAYTWRCLIYFLTIKSFLSIITFIVTILAVVFSIPLALCLFGPALYLVKTIGVWQKEVAFEFLA